MHAKQLRLVAAERLQHALRNVPQLLRTALAPVVELFALTLVAQVDDAVLCAYQNAGLVGKFHERHENVVYVLLAPLMLPPPRGIQLGAKPVGKRALRVLEMLSPNDMHRHSEVALRDRTHEAVAKALLTPQIFFVARLEYQAFQLVNLNKLVVFREQRFGIVVGDVRNEPPQALLLLLRLAAGGGGPGTI